MKQSQPDIHRPWGGYTIIKKTALFWVKKLHVLPGARLSLQSHKLRNEVWFVLEGSIDAIIGTKLHHAKQGDVLFVPLGKKHRIIGKNTQACVLEFAFGRVLERDITRYQDDYNRI